MRHFAFLVALKLIDTLKTVAVVYMTYDFCRWIVKYLVRKYG